MRISPSFLLTGSCTVGPRVTITRRKTGMQAVIPSFATEGTDQVGPSYLLQRAGTIQRCATGYSSCEQSAHSDGFPLPWSRSRRFTTLICLGRRADGDVQGVLYITSVEGSHGAFREHASAILKLFPGQRWQETSFRIEKASGAKVVNRHHDDGTKSRKQLSVKSDDEQRGYLDAEHVRT